MLTRNQLTYAVIWPSGPDAALQLVTDDGEVYGEMSVTEPLKGSELAKLMPDGMAIVADQCSLITTSGKILVQTKTPFDTVVVTERAELTFEDRIAAMEVRERWRDRAYRAKMAEMQAAIDGAGEVIEEPPAETETAPETVSEPVSEPESEGVTDGA